MKILGLTGGIGSGKSVVAELFRIFGIPVYDSDAHSKTLCDTDERLKEKLVHYFGSEIYADGSLNRQFLARIIFTNTENLRAVNALIHPVVEKDFLEWVEKNRSFPAVVQETAILFEAGLEKYFDHIICVTAPENLRIKRVCKRNGLNPEDVRKRIKNQLPEEELIRRSDFVILNDDVHALIPQVNELLKILSNCNEENIKPFFII